MVDSSSSGPPKVGALKSHDPLAAAREKREREAREQAERERIKQEKKAQRNVKRLVGTVALQTAAVGLLVGSFIMQAGVADQAAAHQAQIDQRAELISVEKKRILAAERQQEALPVSVDTAQHSLEQAGIQAERVAERQNALFSLSGPASLEGIPEVDPKPKPGTSARAYTETERVEMAEARKTEQLDVVNRELLPLFAGEARDRDGFDATAPWYEALPSIMALQHEDGSFPEGLHWVHGKVPLFTQNMEYSVGWVLLDENSKVLAVATANYDPRKRTLTNVELIDVGQAHSDAQDQNAQTTDKEETP